MWEIHTKKLPFEDCGLFNNELEIEIALKGLRPKIDSNNEEWDSNYVSLIKSCWSEIPNCRPSAQEIAKELSKLRNGEEIDFSNFTKVDEVETLDLSSSKESNPFLIRKLLPITRKIKTFDRVKLSPETKPVSFLLSKRSLVQEDTKKMMWLEYPEFNLPSPSPILKSQKNKVSSNNEKKNNFSFLKEEEEEENEDDV